MTNYSKHIGAAAICGLLAACGGGGGDDGPQTVFNYQTFDSTVPGESRVAAAGLTRTDPDGEYDGTEVVLGTLERASREITISVDHAGNITGVYNSNTQIWTDVSGGKVYANDALTGNFQFILPVIVEDSDGLDNSYILGVVSRTQDLPITPGITTYSGSAIVRGNMSPDGSQPNQSFQSAGDLGLAVDFTSRELTATISELTGMPFETVELRQLEISSGSDATFSLGGGSVVFLRDGSPYTPEIGTILTTDADGAFFGIEEGSPAEAGGAFAVVGQTGNIYGIFVADELVNTP